MLGGALGLTERRFFGKGPLLLGVGAALVLAAPADARGPLPSVKAKTTGDRSELIETVPIKRSPGSYRVAMALRARSTPNLEPGDLLRASSEVVVSTDCTFSSPRCAGNPYVFNPRLQTQLVLTDGESDYVLARDRRRCLQEPGDREHHCQIVFDGVQTGTAPGELDCAADACGLELRIRAWSARADGGEAVIIGASKPGGRIVQDKGRINVIRFRGGAQELGKTSRGGLVRDEVPLDLKKRVVMSVRLDRLDEGDVLEVVADARAHVGHLPFPALVGSQLVLAEGPGEAHGHRFVRRIANLKGEITENSGTNCTQAKTPCALHRAGVLVIREDVRRRNGDPRPLWVNLVVRSTAKRAEGGAGEAVKLENRNGLRVRRYPARG